MKRSHNRKQQSDNRSTRHLHDQQGRAQSSPAVTTKLSKLQDTLFTPIHKGSIVFFRVVFGLVLFWMVCQYFNYGRIDKYFISPNFYFKYYGFSWVHPWPGDGMYYHFAAIGICALCLACGFLYRFTTVLTFFLFTYMFLLDQTRYLNHYYFVALLLLIMMFVPANRAFSIDALLWPHLKEKPIHRWTVWLLRFQIGCVYFFGGIAKINPDWLRGEPMREWLGNMKHFPLVGNLLASEFTAWAFSYGGLVFDLGIVWLILYKPTRTFGVLLICFFHFSNAVMFNIGIFPWLMLLATPLFFSPDWPHRVITTCFNYQLKNANSNIPIAQALQQSKWKQTYGFWLIILFVTLQCLIPLRHHLYPGSVDWNREGFRFAWRMRLTSSRSKCNLSVRTDQIKAANIVDFGKYLASTSGYKDLTSEQLDRMVIQPDMIIQYAHYMVDHLEQLGHTNVIVTVRSESQLHDRPWQTFIDPTVNFAELSRDLKHCNWIVPLGPRVKSVD